MGISTIRSKLKRGLALTQKESGDLWEYIRSLEKQPKTGHWIYLGVMPSDLGDYRWCSNCNRGIDVMEFHRNHYNYCPNCGARMIKSEDKE